MNAPPPIPFIWDGESFSPAGQHWARRADDHYVIGETYRLIPHEERSPKSHSHYFAAVKEAWDNLPEDMAERFATPDHLRRWCLIKAGYRDERTVVCASKAEAQRVASFVKPIDDYAVVVARDAVVIVWTAKSQSLRAMGRAEFQASKTAVLDILAGMVKVEASALKREAGQAA